MEASKLLEVISKLARKRPFDDSNSKELHTVTTGGEHAMHSKRTKPDNAKNKGFFNIPLKFNWMSGQSSTSSAGVRAESSGQTVFETARENLKNLSALMNGPAVKGPVNDRVAKGNSGPVQIKQEPVVEGYGETSGTSGGDQKDTQYSCEGKEEGGEEGEEDELTSVLDPVTGVMKYVNKDGDVIRTSPELTKPANMISLNMVLDPFTGEVSYFDPEGNEVSLNINCKTLVRNKKAVTQCPVGGQSQADDSDMLRTIQEMKREITPEGETEGTNADTGDGKFDPDIVDNSFLAMLDRKITEGLRETFNSRAKEPDQVTIQEPDNVSVMDKASQKQRKSGDEDVQVLPVKWWGNRKSSPRIRKRKVVEKRKEKSETTTTPSSSTPPLARNLKQNEEVLRRTSEDFNKQCSALECVRGFDGDLDSRTLNPYVKLQNLDLPRRLESCFVTRDNSVEGLDSGANWNWCKEKAESLTDYYIPDSNLVKAFQNIPYNNRQDQDWMTHSSRLPSKVVYTTAEHLKGRDILVYRADMSVVKVKATETDSSTASESELGQSSVKPAAPVVSAGPAVVPVSRFENVSLCNSSLIGQPRAAVLYLEQQQQEESSSESNSEDPVSVSTCSETVEVKVEPVDSYSISVNSDDSIPCVVNAGGRSLASGSTSGEVPQKNSISLSANHETLNLQPKMSTTEQYPSTSVSESSVTNSTVPKIYLGPNSAQIVSQGPLGTLAPNLASGQPLVASSLVGPDVPSLATSQAILAPNQPIVVPNLMGPFVSKPAKTVLTTAGATSFPAMSASPFTAVPAQALLPPLYSTAPTMIPTVRIAHPALPPPKKAKLHPPKTKTRPPPILPSLHKAPPANKVAIPRLATQIKPQPPLLQSLPQLLIQNQIQSQIQSQPVPVSEPAAVAKITGKNLRYILPSQNPSQPVPFVYMPTTTVISSPPSQPPSIVPETDDRDDINAVYAVSRRLERLIAKNSGNNKPLADTSRAIAEFLALHIRAQIHAAKTVGVPLSTVTKMMPNFLGNSAVSKTPASSVINSIPVNEIVKLGEKPQPKDTDTTIKTAAILATSMPSVAMATTVAPLLSVAPSVGSTTASSSSSSDFSQVKVKEEKLDEELEAQHGNQGLPTSVSTESVSHSKTDHTGPQASATDKETGSDVKRSKRIALRKQELAASCNSGSDLNVSQASEVALEAGDGNQETGTQDGPVSTLVPAGMQGTSLAGLDVLPASTAPSPCTSGSGTSSQSEVKKLLSVKVVQASAMAPVLPREVTSSGPLSPKLPSGVHAPNIPRYCHQLLKTGKLKLPLPRFEIESIIDAAVQSVEGSMTELLPGGFVREALEGIVSSSLPQKLAKVKANRRIIEVKKKGKEKDDDVGADTEDYVQKIIQKIKDEPINQDIDVEPVGPEELAADAAAANIVANVFRNEKVTYDIEHLQNVQKIVTDNGCYWQCPLCKKKFSRNYTFKRHVETHSGIRRHRCDVCGKGFTDKRYLLKHKRWHSGKNLLYCNICARPFADELGLKKHMRLHSGENTCTCSQCEKVFSDKSTLRRHILNVHEGVKPFRCGICDHSFVFKSHLEDHMRRHTGEKPYECAICGRGFVQIGTRNRHEKLHQQGNTYKFSCRFCNWGFKWSKSLRMHLLKAHSVDPDNPNRSSPPWTIHESHGEYDDVVDNGSELEVVDIDIVEKAEVGVIGIAIDEGQAAEADLTQEQDDNLEVDADNGMLQVDEEVEEMPQELRDGLETDEEDGRLVVDEDDERLEAGKEAGSLEVDIEDGSLEPADGRLVVDEDDERLEAAAADGRLEVDDEDRSLVVDVADERLEVDEEAGSLEVDIEDGSLEPADGGLEVDDGDGGLGVDK